MNILLLPLLLAIGDAPITTAPDIVVVCPAEFRPALEPWVDRRQQQGHVLQFLGNDGTAMQVREQIRKAAKDGSLKFVVLVGDAPGPQAEDSLRARCTPTFRLPSQITRYWGGDADFASDNPYADLDDDGVPDLAVGRMSARRPEELTTIVKKILAYEDSRDFGPWRTRINFVAGEGGYGQLIDSAVQQAIPRTIGCELPAAYQCTLTNAVWRSPFCPDPRSFHGCSLERMNEGCLFWVFMGHGAPRTLQWAAFPDGHTPILQCEDCARLKCGGTPAIAMCMCCLTGAFAEDDDCLAEELLRAPGGPVAVFSGSNVTMPYGMAALARQAVHAYFDGHCGTVGQWLLQAKRNTMAGYDLPVWSLLHAVTVAAAPPGIDLKQERLEHLQLFNLLGDPTMRLMQPQAIEVAAPPNATAGESITVSVDCRIIGSATIELVAPWDQKRTELRDRYDGSATGRQQFDAVYRKMNNAVISSVKAETTSGSISAKLPVPETAGGNYCVRVFIEGKDNFAVGATHIQIAEARQSHDNSPDVAGKPAANTDR
jgi:hypothetical protein